MKDISKYENYISSYGGSELKKTYYLNGYKYMVKLPDPIRKKSKTISYINNQFSEFIGCKIFELFNINVQEVYLVSISLNNKVKIGVACKDFLNKDETLIEFKDLAMSLSFDKHYSCDVIEIFDMISQIKDITNFKEYFYKVFIIDTLLGNVDRHLGNWGLILKDNKYRLSPIYDCGSCLHPLISEEEMVNLLDDEKEFKNISLNLKTAYKYNDKKMNYIDFYEMMPDGLKDVLISIYKDIDMDKIKSVIYNTECISDTMKDFYYKSILYRKKYILDIYYKKYSYN